MNPFISIIIPAKNAQGTIKKCIDSVLRLNYGRFEVIIINDGSCDDTGKILAGYQSIKVLDTKGVGPSLARNAAAAQAQGEFLAFTDADCIVEKNWLEGLMEGFSCFPEAAACGGKQELPDDASDFQKKLFLLMNRAGFITDYMRRGKNKIIEVPHNASCCVMYRKDIFIKEGGFLGELWPGEDVELDHRLKKAGYQLVFNPQTGVFHYRTENLNGFLRMMDRYGWAQGLLVKKYGIFRKIQMLPLITAGLAFLSALLILTGKIEIIVLLILILFSIIFIYLRFDLAVLGLGILGFINWHKGFIQGFFCGKQNK